MKNLINYLYNVDITKMYLYMDNYILETIKNQNYQLLEVSDKDMLPFIIEVSNFIQKNINTSYYIVKNIYNDYSFLYEEKVYVVMKIGDNFHNNLDFIDMVEFYDKSSNYFSTNINRYKNNWKTLWENKMNYLILHEKNNSNKNTIDQVLFFYYIGLAENALLYINDIKNSASIEFENASFVHRRINYENNYLCFYNPLEIIIDSYVRDVAEYIKLQFYKGQDYLTDLEYYLKTKKLSVYEASILYARIIYPSYYFDFYENEHKSILKSKNFFNINDLEKFLSDVYILINKYVPIKKVEWL